MTRRPAGAKALVGVDVFIHDRQHAPDELGAKLQAASTDALVIKMITSRGVKVWPGGFPETSCGDHWRCRFTPPEALTALSHGDVIELLRRMDAAGLDFIKTEQLYTFNGQPAYSLAQGE